MTSKQTEGTTWTISPRDTLAFCGEIRQKINEVTGPLAEVLEKFARAKMEADDAAAISDLKTEVTERHKDKFNVASQARKQVLAFEEAMNPEINRWPAILDEEEAREKAEQQRLIREHQAALAMSNERIGKVQQRRNELYADYQSCSQMLQALANELIVLISESAESI